MSAYALPEISQLEHELKLSPTRLRLKQVRGIERALAVVESTAGYPYELVCYWITGFRPRRSVANKPLSGQALIPDLARLAEDLSRNGRIPATVLREPFFTQEELAERFNVSPKTISRWRLRGLGGFRAVLQDGQVKLVITESSVRRFVVRNVARIQKAAAFSQLTAEEKSRIVDRARKLLADDRLKLHEVSQQIAAETGRAVETIRYTLRRHDKENPDQAVFERNGKPRVHPDHRRIYAAYQDGQPAEAIARIANKPVAVVRRLINELRAREIHQRPIDYMYNEAFEAPNADAEILEGECPAAAETAGDPSCSGDLPKGESNSAANPYHYFQELSGICVLSKSEEQDLFRRYNYLKHKASRLRDRLDPVTPDLTILERIEGLLRHADAVKNHLIRCNLRLVVNIAKRHVGMNGRFFEVVSDGNMAMMRSVEKFDYARGHKFSTYATWAVMKTYARTIPEHHYRTRRFMTGHDEVLLSAEDTSEPTGPLSHLHAVKEALAIGWKVLTSREQNVLRRHFGLQSSGKPETLDQIGQAIGISKERVRQIEKEAMGKLRVAMAPMQADLIG